MISGTLEHEIYIQECYRMDKVEEAIQQMEYEDLLAESPVVLCSECNVPFKSLGEANCETCQAEQDDFHFDYVWAEEDIPF